MSNIVGNIKDRELGENEVFVSKFNDGDLIKTAEGNEDITLFLVRSEEVVESDGGFYLQERIALVRMSTKLFKRLYSNLQEGDILNGKIVYEESNQKFFDEDSPVINPKTSEIVPHSVTGEPFYRRKIFTTELDRKDSFITSPIVEDSKLMKSVKQHFEAEVSPF